MVTPARRIIPGTVYEVSRRTVGSEFRLVADERIVELYEFLLQAYSEMYDVKPLATTVVMNHYHLTMLDTNGQAPAFMQAFDSTMARALNCYQGTQGTVWCGNGYTPLAVLTDEAQLARLDYLIENPLSANLVRRLRDYPQVRVRPDDIMRRKVIKRPKFFFSEHSALPEQVTQRFYKLPALAHLSDQEYCRFVAERIKSAEDRHIERRRRSGESVCGERRLRRIQWYWKPEKRRTWFRLRPELAAKDRMAMLAGIRELRRFRAHYREALAAWHAGDKTAVFPYGTWKMRREFGVVVEAMPP